MRAIIITSISFLLVSSHAEAVCIKGKPSIEREYADSLSVFIGKVISKKNVAQSSDYFEGDEYTVEAQEILKGKPRNPIVIFSENSSGRFLMNVGKTYLMFVHYELGRYQISNCGNSGILPDKNEVVLSVRTLKQNRDPRKRHEFSSPDGKYRAVVIPLPNAPYGSGESKIEIHSTKDAVLCSKSYGSEDGEHGFGVEKADWTSDSKFFVYSMSSSGGHQSWHFPTYFISVSDFKARKLDDYLGLITDPTFELTSPDIIHVAGHPLNDLENETEFESSLSKMTAKIK